MKIKNHYTEKALNFTQRLSDPRFVGQLVFVLIVLLVSWSGIKSIQSNYALQKQIAVLKQQTRVQELKNANQKLQNDYYDSNQYLETSARQNFGLAVAGEKEILVPKSVALAYTVDLPQTAATTGAASLQPSRQRNFEAWINFFLHRQNLAN